MPVNVQSSKLSSYFSSGLWSWWRVSSLEIANESANEINTEVHFFFTEYMKNIKKYAGKEIFSIKREQAEKWTKIRKITIPDQYRMNSPKALFTSFLLHEWPHHMTLLCSSCNFERNGLHGMNQNT